MTVLGFNATPIACRLRLVLPNRDADWLASTECLTITRYFLLLLTRWSDGKKSKTSSPEADTWAARRLPEGSRSVEADKEEILAKGRVVFAAHQTACKAIKQLKKARLKQGLSLADIRQRTGIGREAISKLENDPTPNPTIRTLVRYAKAVGVKLELKVE